MISKKIVFGLVLLATIGLSIGTYWVRTNHNDTNENQAIKKVEASSISATLTSQADWQAGANTGADLTGSQGNVKIDLSAGGPMDLISIYNADNSSVVATTDNANRSLSIDDNSGTYWHTTTPAYNTDRWTIDIGATHTFAYLQLVSFNNLSDPEGVLKINVSTDNVIYNDLCLLSWVNVGQLDIANSSTDVRCSGIHPFTARYVRAYIDKETSFGDNDWNFIELDLYPTPTATHTSGTTQLNGGDNFFEWQTFSPTYTKPTNTDVQFRFRSSTNGTDWGSWTSYQTPSSGSALDITSLVTSRTGSTDNPTFYKYLQVETKLSSTDGTSTPTLSEYSIGRHTNKKPNKPTGN